MTALQIKKCYSFTRFLLIALLAFGVPFFAQAVDDDVTVTVEVADCVDCAEGEGGESGSTSTTGDSGNGSFSFDNLEITPAFESIVIRWDTAVPSKSTVKWGESASYEIGSLSEGDFSYEHVVVIENLDVAADYFVRIDAVSDGGERAFFAQKIATLSPQDVVVPPSVANVRVFHNNDRVEIRFEIPRYALYDSIRIMRSTTGFPLSPQDGERVFERDADIFVDTDIDPDVTYYYSIFVRDELGNYSAAALAVSSPAQRQSGGAFDELPDGREVVPLSILNLTLLDIRFLQGEERLAPNKEQVTVDSKQNITLSIPAPIFPNFHSHVLLTVSSPDDPETTYLYLLNYNERNDAYEVTLQPFFDTGISEFALSFLDVNNRLYRKIEGQFKIEKSKEGSLGNIGAVIADATRAGAETIAYGVERFGALIVSAIESAYEAVIAVIAAIGTLVVSLIKGVFNFFSVLLRGVISLVFAFTGVVYALGNIFSDTLTLLGMTTLGLHSAMTDLFGETFVLAYKAGDGTLAVLGSLGTGIRIVLGGVSGALAAVSTGLISGVASIAHDVLAIGVFAVGTLQATFEVFGVLASFVGDTTAGIARVVSSAFASLAILGEAGLRFGESLSSGVDAVTTFASRGVVAALAGLASMGDLLIAISDGIKIGYLAIGQGVVTAFDVMQTGTEAGASMMANSYESVKDLMKEMIDEIIETFKRFG